ncbi:MAG: hypothetical protein IPH13_20745 [Planctomycetes bacterium]|nr:hypothetical protein [Planctomycetota bacterium]
MWIRESVPSRTSEGLARRVAEVDLRGSIGLASWDADGTPLCSTHALDQEDSFRLWEETLPDMDREPFVEGAQDGLSRELLTMYGANIAARARLSFYMILMGAITLVAGIVMLFLGLTSDERVWFQSGDTSITATGFGAVTMTASIAWGALAYLTRPQVGYAGPYGLSCSPGLWRSKAPFSDYGAR